MRLGLIARADNRGLGQQTWAFHRNMQPVKTMVVDCPSQNPLPLHLDRFPDATVVRGWPTERDFRSWLTGLDVVYTAETGYSAALWSEAQRAGVKTVLHANYEFLNRADRPSLWAAPSMWHVNDFPRPKLHLPVPIETDRLLQRILLGRPNHFLHIVGRPAIHDRNGTLDLLKAIPHIKSDVTVTIRCQQPGYVSGLAAKHNLLHTPRNVTLAVDSADVENYWDNYATGDVLVMPRRFGGLCLPVNEALGAGMPVIMPDISPNNSWLPQEWLTPASKQGSFVAKQRIDFYQTDPKVLARKIDAFTDPDFYAKQVDEALRLRDELSWKRMLPRYREVLGNV